MDKSDDYDKYLKSLHSKKRTPDEIIRDFVKEGSGKDIISKRKIISGEVNEVYEINLSDNSKVILRISPNGSPDFQQEQWVIKECKKVGVPVPDIFMIKYQIIDSIEYGFCLMEKIEGDTLERGKIDFNNLDLDEKKNYIYQAGEILSKIHSITTTGWGSIIKDKGEYDDANDLFENWIEEKENYEKIAKEENIKASLINKANELVEKFRERYKSIKPCLNHGDFSHKHFMVSRGKIVGILDWGCVRSDIPIYDFASWDFWFGENIPTQWLKDGYINKELLKNDFDDFLHFIRITKALETLDWYHKQKYTEIVEKIKAKFIKDVSYFM
ncbi:aminoglycoside phosphotransferase family protein [Microgenomates group bacterium]|nr:aminoglycoside phosphotransferase family protein [Microgenomates group bacterium]